MLIFICLTICFFSITSVCANEVNETVVANEDQSIIGVDHEVSVLKEDSSVGNFTDLNNIINSGKTEIVLDCDYKYDSACDSDYQRGVTISKGLVIDGNGHTIDGNGEAKLLQVSGKNVILRNIVFTNIFSSSTQTDGAIKWVGDNGILTNCNFTNISVKYGTTALSMAYASLTSGKYLQISNCNFINNYVRTDGNTITLGGNVQISNCKFINNTVNNGVIYGNLYSNDPTIINCEFINNHATSGSILKSLYYTIELSHCSFVSNSATSEIVYAKDDKCNLSYCNFINNTASSYGMVYLVGDECSLNYCSFVGNSAAYGGAIYLKGNEGTLSNCYFVDNIATSAGGGIYWNGLDGIVDNCLFVNNVANTGGAIYWLSNYGTLLNCSFIQNSASATEGEGGAIRWNGKYGNISNCNFYNNSAFGGSSISLYGANSIITNCSFDNNVAYGAAGAVYCDANECAFRLCSFVNNFAAEMGGAMFLSNSNYIIESCNFVNNSADYGGAIIASGNYSTLNFNSFNNNSASTWGGAIYWVGAQGQLTNSSFSNNSAVLGGSIFWQGDDGFVFDCLFKDNVALKNGSSIYWFGNDGNLTKCIVTDNIGLNQVYWWNKENGYIADCKFINNTNGVIHNGANFVRNPVSLTYSNSSCYYKSPTNISVYLKNILNNLPITSQIIFSLVKNEDSMSFTVDLKNNIASICDELSELDAGVWRVTAIFEGDDNHAPCNTTFTITINPIVSLLAVAVNDTIVGHETLLISNVSNLINSTVNGGIVTYYDNQTNIGEVNVVDGIAALTYVPETAGEHTITAIFNSSNYLSSNDTAKLLVDSVIVEMIVDEGSVGFESNFIANVKGLYSTIEEGFVTFYLNEEPIGSVPVVNGLANLTYIPLNAGSYVVKSVFSSDKFMDNEANASFTVNKADSNIIMIMEDVNVFVGHKLTIKSNVISSNNLTVNEGVITFFDGETNIGDVNVVEGVATLTYAPVTAGEHTIVAVYNSNNYADSKNATLLLVDKAKVDLIVFNVKDVYFNNPSLFAITIYSDFKEVNEGKINYYVNDTFVGSSNINNGETNFEYVANMSGTFILTVVFEETNNYQYANYTTLFRVVEENNKETNTTQENATDNNSENTSDVNGTLEPEVVIPQLDEISGEDAIPINFPSDATGTVTLTVDGKDYKFDVVDGKANVKLPELTNGDYQYTITYSGDGKYSPFTNAGSLKVNKTTVNPADNKTNINGNTSQENTTIVDNSQITASDKKVTYATGKYYTIKVYGKDGLLADGVKVVITVNGKTFKTLTTKDGVAKFKVTQKPGTYKMNITALGKSVTKTLTVKHLVTLKSVAVKKSAKKLVLQATLGKINGKYLKNKKVTFKFNGKTYKAKTDKKGVAKVTIKSTVLKKLKVGKKVTYQATYSKDTVKKTVKIKK